MLNRCSLSSSPLVSSQYAVPSVIIWSAYLSYESEAKRHLEKTDKKLKVVAGAAEDIILDLKELEVFQNHLME